MRLACLLLFAALLSAAPADDIKAIILGQQAAWNRGDIPAFMKAYDKSADTTFVGSTVTKGYAAVEARYNKSYSSREQMGQLAFSELDVRVLDAKTAIVTGRFHLERTAAGGGESKGIFTLVWRKQADGWKVVHDHTSSLK